MMRALFRTMGIAATAAMMTATTAASAETPATVSAPATETVDNGSGLHSDVSGTTIIEIGILAALVVIVLVATRGGNSSSSTPTSP